jgi:hypothetical protein
MKDYKIGGETMYPPYARSYGAGIIAMLLLVFIPGPAGAESSEVSLSGTVKDGAGKAVAQARVRLSDGVRFFAAITDENGRYEMHVPTGRYSASATYPGEEQKREGLPTLPNWNVRGLDVREQPMRLDFPPADGETVELVLTDPTGRFVSGLELLITSVNTDTDAPRAATRWAVRCSRAFEDASQRCYRVRGMPAGQYSLSLLVNKGYSFAPFHASQLVFDVPVTNTGIVRVEVPLTSPSIPLTGSVENVTGQPVSGGKVFVGTNADGMRSVEGHPFSTVSTRADGSFATEALAPSRYWIAGEVPGTHTLREQAEDGSGNRRGGPLYVYATQTIRSGDPPAPVRLTLPKAEPAALGSLTARVMAGPNGVPVRGARVMLLQGPGHLFMGETIYPSALEIDGKRLSDEGPGYGPAPIVRQTDEQGRFTIGSLPAGEYAFLITASTPGWAGKYLRVSLRDGERLNLDVALPSIANGGRLSGAIKGLDTQRLRPLGFLVYVISRTTGAATVAPVGTDGRFDGGILPAGEYELMVVEVGPLMPVKITDGSSVTITDGQKSEVSLVLEE